MLEAGLGGASRFDFQYIPRLAKEKMEAPGIGPRDVSLLRRKLEVFLFLVFVSVGLFVVWTAGSVLLAAYWLARRCVG